MKKYITSLAVLLLIGTSSAQAQLEGDYATSAIAYPTGRVASSSLLLEKVYPKKARVGQNYQYQIKATNLTEFDLENVVVTEVIPTGFTVENAEPPYDNKIGDQYIWKFDSLESRDVAVIGIEGMSSSKRAVPCCTSAVYEIPELCHKTFLEDPSLSVRVRAPETRLMCDPIPLVFTVKNTGDSYLTDIVVQSALPLGVSTDQGRDILFLKATDLRPGETRDFEVLAKANRTGTFTFNAEAKSDDITAQAVRQETKIVKPTLSVKVDVNRKKQFIGRALEYTINVENTSDIDTEEVVVRTSLPVHTEFISADNRGRVVGNAVEWSIGRLSGRDSKRLKMNVEANAFGQAETITSAQGYCVEASVGTARASLVGIPALLLEVVDLVDPIEVGDTETYQIRVTNQGTAVAHNVRISAQLEGMSHVSDTGETRSSDTTGNRIEFYPVARLSPKESVMWSINVSGDETGDLRFRVSLTSDELTRPVEEAESTFVY